MKSRLTGTFPALKALLKLACCFHSLAGAGCVPQMCPIPPPAVAAAALQRHQHCPTTPLLHHDQGQEQGEVPFPSLSIEMGAFLKNKAAFDFFAANGPFHHAYRCPGPPVKWNWVFVPGYASPSHLGAPLGNSAQGKLCTIKKH